MGSLSYQTLNDKAKPVSRHSPFTQLPSALSSANILCLIAYIANSMDPYQTAPIGSV